jgi:DNA-binding MarR family transcriptional regulator
MPDGQDNLTTSPDLAILIVGAAHALGVRLRRELNAAGFPVRQAHGYVLRALHERALGLTALAELLGVTKQAAAQVVDEMVDLGLVDRSPDPHDRRAKRLALPPRGRAARARALEVSAALEREIPHPEAVRAGLLAIVEAEGFGEDAANRRARPPVW